MKKSLIITTNPATWVLFPKTTLMSAPACTFPSHLLEQWLMCSVGAPACGDVMKLQIRVDESGKISDVKFKTFGCGSAIASSSFMTERVKGLTLEEAGKIRNTEVAKELSLPPVKCTCLHKYGVDC
jgi:NifU-like protein involved in Fe-S cluster formation